MAVGKSVICKEPIEVWAIISGGFEVRPNEDEMDALQWNITFNGRKVEIRELKVSIH